MSQRDICAYVVFVDWIWVPHDKVLFFKPMAPVQVVFYNTLSCFVCDNLKNKIKDTLKTAKSFGHGGGL